MHCIGFQHFDIPRLSSDFALFLTGHGMGRNGRTNEVLLSQGLEFS